MTQNISGSVFLEGSTGPSKQNMWWAGASDNNWRSLGVFCEKHTWKTYYLSYVVNTHLHELISSNSCERLNEQIFNLWLSSTQGRNFNPGVKNSPWNQNSLCNWARYLTGIYNEGKAEISALSTGLSLSPATTDTFRALSNTLLTLETLVWVLYR